MDIFSLCILLLAGLFLWWVIKERGRNERERQVSVELVNRLFRLDERLLKLEGAVEQLQSADSTAAPKTSLGQIEETTSQMQISAVSAATSLPASKLQTSSPETSESLTALASSNPVTLDLDSARTTKGLAANTLLSANGEDMPVNTRQIGTALQAAPRLKKPSTPAPKLDEMGMAALLCGLALLMSNDQRAKDKPDQK